MSEAKSAGNSGCNNNFGPLHVIVLCVGFGLIAAGLIFAAMSNKNKISKIAADEQAFLDSLHLFPEIEFVDSLYAKVQTAKYDNDEETAKDVYYYEYDSTGKITDNIVHETHFYENQQKYIDGNVKSERRDGLWYAYYPDGTVQTKAFYKNGLEEGRYVVYYPNGNVRYTGLYRNGKEVGEWRFYNEDGTFAKSKNFN